MASAGRLTALQALRLEDCSAAGTRGGRFTDAGLARLASCTLLLEARRQQPSLTQSPNKLSQSLSSCQALFK